MSVRRRVSVWAGAAALMAGLCTVVVTPPEVVPGGFSSGFEAGDAQPTWTGAVQLDSGTAHTGSTALTYTGAAQVFDVDIEVGADTTLSYWLFPRSGVAVAVDLAFTDGTFLRDSGAVDQHGVRVHPRDQGGGQVLRLDTWNFVTSAIGAAAGGRTVDRILIAHDPPEGAGEVRGHLDDLRISPGTAGSPAELVDTRRGSDSDRGYSRGNTFPGAAVPHGFNFWTPVTSSNDDAWLYRYRANTVQGFAISHQPSPWIRDYGQLQVMPMTGAVRPEPQARQSTFRHEHEVAKAHYYRTRLDTYGITAELAPTDHAGVMRFTFPGGSEPVILFDTVDSAGGAIDVDASARTVSGYTDHNGAKLYFSATVDAAITGSGAVAGPGATSWIRVATTFRQQVTMRVGTSWISVAQAAANREQEVGDRTLDTVRDEAAAQWDALLSQVRVEGAAPDQLVTLYSNLYRAFMYPNNRSELVGGVRRYFSPYDDTVRDGHMYVNNGFWDTARAEWPLLTLLEPGRAGEMLDGFVNVYKTTGWTPSWSAPQNLAVMPGTNQDLAFADAYIKGVRNFDHRAAYASMVKNAMVYSTTVDGRPGLDVSTFKGYVPTDVRGYSASWTLEDATNDFGIAQLAQALGHEEDAAYFRNRALDYVNLFSPSVGFYRGRQSNGAWRTSDAEFHPSLWGCEFVEGAPWHYSTPAPQDPQGMANLYGGRAQLAAKLDAMLAAPRGYLPGCYGGPIHEMLEIYDTGMGQYAHANEPTHHQLYMYNYAGTPARTQDHVRRVLTTLYSSGAGTGGGYLGDEDNGQMSAWYIFSALGFYPARMATTDYTIGAPLHPKASVTLDNGRTFTVTAPGVSDTNRFIQSATLNGVAYTRNYLT
jgi:predicted alpha-1,2-mannosidase